MKFVYLLICNIYAISKCLYFVIFIKKKLFGMTIYICTLISRD